MIGIAVKVDTGAARGLAEAMPPDRLERVIIAAFRKAMGPVISAIRANAPIGKTNAKKRHLAGLLARSIKLKVRTQHGPLRITVAAAPYGHLVERGHRLVRGGRVARLNVGIERLEGRRRGLFFGGRVRTGRLTGRVIGQVKPRPFAQPIIDARIDEISRAVSDGVVRALTLAARIRRATQ